MTDLNNIDPLIEAFSLLVDTTGPVLEYRIHYDTNGNITGCSANGYPEDGNYLIVDEATHNNYLKYECVKDGKLIERKVRTQFTKQLEPSQNGWRTVNGHANIVLDETEEHNNIQHYAYRNN